MLQRSHPKSDPNVAGGSNHSRDRSNLAALIVEVDGTENIGLQRPLPIIAFCDFASKRNLVSSKFVDELEGILKLDDKHTFRLRSQNGGEALVIHWSCERLGQDNQENIFYVEPRAQFKILFGCRKPEVIVPPKWIDSFQGSSVWKRKKEQSKKLQLSEQVVESFRQGLKDGTMQQLRRLPSQSHDMNQYISIATLEAEIDYFWRSFSNTEDALHDESSPDDDSSYKASSPEDLLEMQDISSLLYLDTHTKSYTTSPASTNTSISAGYCHRCNISNMPTLDRTARHPWSLESFLEQSIHEESQPLIREIVQQPRGSYAISICHDQTPRHRFALDTDTRVSGTDFSEYWSWDEEAQNYKHYDVDCDDPVWYEPPYIRPDAAV